MVVVVANASGLGARISEIDLAQPLGEEDFGIILGSLAQHGVIWFPGQQIDAGQLKAFSARFGTLEINVANAFQEPGHPEVMILSNITENGRPIGLSDAGQDWHTDMSYSRDIAFANVLYAIKVPRRDGVALGATEFADMYAACEALPDEVRKRLEGATALHDFNKFWEEMRRRPGSNRPPLTEEQRRQKPPVSHPILLRHPISGRTVLYANPGYAIRIDGWDQEESDRMLDFLFEHQLQERFRYTHRWREGDVLMWDNISTLHNARPDYTKDEHRLIKRCQVMADRVFDADFARRARLGAA
ncbi:TauD/TfdA dioxygenase family protein [Inquilinus limosus]|uniref:TauD/TfdA dioxygenase family protein n=1 Tax=Inquilinus limosus TaxID=171674 RepID=UPI00068D2B5D|nr:TauD/TfdA family dioxygenase [Inquilinus limosus]